MQYCSLRAFRTDRNHSAIPQLATQIQPESKEHLGSLFIAPTDQPLREQYIGTFSALALVCRFFCSVALPRVFERVTFSGDANGNRAQASRTTKWARQIVANTGPAKSVALYVKECTFSFWDLSEGGENWPVRTVMFFGTRGSPTPFTLRPIATTAIRSLEADDVEAVLKI
ncbi:hypothetical protein EDB19DRAFT_2022881, partial [Suillus lakei]